jgi:hypothetical protein
LWNPFAEKYRKYGKGAVKRYFTAGDVGDSKPFLSLSRRLSMQDKSDN